MQSGLKKFKTYEDKQTFELITGDGEVDIHSFSAVNKRIIGEAEMLRIKNKMVLESVKIVNAMYTDMISQHQLRVLQDNPDSFTLKKGRGDTKLETIEESLQKVSSHTIVYLFNYKGLLKLNRFLLERSNNILREYKDLRKKYLEVCVDKNSLESELKGFKTPDFDEVEVPDPEMELFDEEFAEFVNVKADEREEEVVRSEIEEEVKRGVVNNGFDEVQKDGNVGVKKNNIVDDESFVDEKQSSVVDEKQSSDDLTDENKNLFNEIEEEEKVKKINSEDFEV